MLKSECSVHGQLEFIPGILYRILIRFFYICCLAIALSGCKQENPVDELFDAPPSQNDDSTALSLQVIGGNNQVAMPGATFPDSLRVQLLQGSTPVSDASVNFVVSSASGGGAFSSSSVTTDSFGIASTNFTSNGIAGETTVQASYDGLVALFRLTAIDQTGTQIALLSGNNQTGDVNSTLANQLVTQVTYTSSGLPAVGILVRYDVTTGNGRINSISNSITATTDASGQTSVSFDVGTIAGINNIKATIVSVPTSNVTFSATGIVPPGSTVDPNTSSITATPNSLSADGASTTLIQFTARDVFGNQIPSGGGTVVFSTDAGTLLGGVTDLGNGIYQQTLRAPLTTAINPLTVSGTVNASPISGGNASVSLLSGAIDLTTSTLTVDNTQVVADGASTALLTLTLRDSLSNPVGTGGETVVLSSTLGSLIGSVIDNGDGTYSQTIRAPINTGLALVSATVGGSPVVDTENIDFIAGSVDPALSTIISTPSVILPNGISTSVINFLAKDSNNNSITVGGETVVFTKTNGTWSGSGTATITATDNGDGSYSATLISSPTPGQSTITGTVGGSPITDDTIVYFTSSSSGPSTTLSLVEITGSTLIPADNSTTTSVRVTLMDSDNQQITSGGNNVVLSTTAGTLLGSIIDNGDGTYTQLIRSPSTASANITISATVEGQVLADTAAFNAYGSFSLSTSTITSTPSAIEADGFSASTIILQAKDTNGVSIPVGGEVGLALSTDQGSLLGSLSDNGNGTYTQILQSSAVATTATVSGTLSAVPLSDTAQVEFFLPVNLAGLTIDCSNVVVGGYKNSNIFVDGGTLTMNSKDGVTDCGASDFLFKTVVLRNGATLTHSATNDTNIYGLEFTTDYLEIDASSSIDVTAKGFVSAASSRRFRTQGNQDVLNMNSNDNVASGGSHGGQGAGWSTTYFPNETYGSIFEPSEPGSSGGGWPGWLVGAGGGQLKINVTSGGFMVVNGSIQSNGYGRNSGSTSCGAGGSIYISTPLLTGSGTITANGGGGTGGNNSPGGGGRIAIYYNSFGGNFGLNPKANINAYGGVSTSGSTPIQNKFAGAGTVYLKSDAQTYGDLIIDNQGNINNSLLSSKTPIDAPAATIPDVITSTLFQSTGNYGDTYSNSSPYVGWYVDPDINQNPTDTKSDNVLFKVTTATSNFLQISTGDLLSIGGVAKSGELVAVFDNVDITGGALVTGAATILVYDGDFHSGNTSMAVTSGNVPSGLEFSGASEVVFDLENSPLSLTSLANSNFTLNVTFKNGNFTLGDVTAGGNVNLEAGTFNIDSIVAGDSILLDGADLTAGKSIGNLTISASNQISITNGSNLFQKDTTLSEEFSLEIDSNGIDIDGSSSIDAIGKGYMPPTSNGFTVLGNIQETNGWNSSSNVAAGGSHGGHGGRANNHYPANSYGSFANPYTSGGSGCRWGTTNTGHGGGIIRINTNGGSCQINGTINANGTQISNSGGAGGSIYLNCGALLGGGSISANGGTGGSWGAGGGGRVAVYYTSLAGNFTWPSNFQSNVTAYGGYNATSYRRGGAGTVYAKSNIESYGKLVIDNNNVVAATQKTILKVPSAGTSTSLSATVLDAGSGHFNDDYGFSHHAEGLILRPNTLENGTPQYIDDTTFRINSSTDSTVTTAGDMTVPATSGDNFDIFSRFDELYIIGGAEFDFEGVLLAETLDLTGGTLSTSGTLEVASAGSFSIDLGGNSLSLIPLTGNLDVTLNNGSYTTSSVNLTGNLVLQNSANLISTSTSVTGDLQVTDSSLDSENVIVGGDMDADNSNMTLGGVGNQNDTINVDVTGDINFLNGTSVTSHKTNTTNAYFLYFQSDNMTVDVASSIDVSGKGYESGTTGRFQGPGNVIYGNEIGTNNNAAGGCHGGMGGRTGGHYTCEPYGSMVAPIDLGSSTGSWSSPMGDGGGSVRFDIANTLTLDGSISADGESTTREGGGGGSIYIATDTISGSGSMTANGGSGPRYGGGGGGRIALYYTSSSGVSFANDAAIAGSMKTYGGLGGNTNEHAAAGTVYIKNSGDTYGSLVIDNNNTITTYAKTRFPNSSSAASSSISTTVLSAAGAFTNNYSQNDLFLDYYINPNINQNASITLADDQMYKISSNNQSAITIASGDLTSVANNGDDFALVLDLENLEVRNNGKLDFNGQFINVRNGDMKNNDNSTFELDGSIDAETVDVGGATWTDLDESGGSMTNQCASNLPSCL